MQFTNKIKLTKAVSAVTLIGATATVVVLAQSPQTQVFEPAVQSPIQQQSADHTPHLSQATAARSLYHNSLPESRNPLPKEATEAFHAQSVRSQAAEKEARRLLKQRRFAEAEAACYRALALSPKINGVPSINTTQLLGDVYLEQGRYQDAIDTYARARKHTRNLELELNTALCYVRLGDLTSARKFYTEEKVFGQMPQDKKAEFFSQLPGTENTKSFEASIYFARGCEKDSYASNEEAAQDYQKALLLFPKSGLIAYQYAEKLMRLKRYDEALPVWALAARFGKGEKAWRAENKMGAWSAAQREQAIRDAEKIK